MKLRPDPNLTPDAQPWGRATDSEQDTQNANIEVLRLALQEIQGGSVGAQALLSFLQAGHSRVDYELQKLYEATGTPYPPAAAPPPEEPDIPAAPEYKTIEVGVDWTRTWGSSSYYTGGGEYTNATYLYQGQSPENKIGLMRFDVGEARNKNIVAASLYLANRSSAWNYSFAAGLGTHGNVTAPVAKPGRQNGFNVGWNRGEAKWVPLPDWVLPGLSNGSIQGFSVGGMGPDNANSAWFYGKASGGPEPKLGIRFQI